MYGTVARLRIKPGSLDQIAALSREYDDLKIPGHLTTYAIQMDANANECMLVAVFASKDAYLANANSPEQHARYTRMRELLERDPDWHDGQVVHAYTA